MQWETTASAAAADDDDAFHITRGQTWPLYNCYQPQQQPQPNNIYNGQITNSSNITDCDYDTAINVQGKVNQVKKS